MLWTRRLAGAVGRANLDGSGVNQTFITGLTGPRGISIDNTNNKIYILNSNGAITQRDLDGSNTLIIINRTNWIFAPFSL